MHRSDRRTGWGRAVAALVLAAAGLSARAAAAQEQPPPPAEPPIIHADQDKDTAAALRPHLQAGVKKVEQFFGRPFRQPFTVEVLPDRAAFDAYMKRRWQVPKTQ